MDVVVTALRALGLRALGVNADDEMAAAAARSGT
jgi:hypothetical protein